MKTLCTVASVVLAVIVGVVGAMILCALLGVSLFVDGTTKP